MTKNKMTKLDKKTRNFLIILSSIMLIFIITCAAIIISVKSKDQPATEQDEEAKFQQESTRLAEEYANQHPAITKLPLQYAAYDENYNYTEFRIDGGSFENCSTDFCLQITDESDTSDESQIRQLASDLLKSRQINPEDYEILYLYNPPKPLN